MMVTYESNIKKINGRTLETVVEGLDEKDSLIGELTNLFHQVNSLEDLIVALKEMYETANVPYLLRIIRRLCGYSMAEANDVFNEVL